MISATRPLGEVSEALREQQTESYIRQVLILDDE